MSTSEWIAAGIVAAVIVLLLVAQNRRIKREHAEFMAEHERQLAEARAEGVRMYRVLPFQNLAAKRDAGKGSKFGR